MPLRLSAENTTWDLSLFIRFFIVAGKYIFLSRGGWEMSVAIVLCHLGKLDAVHAFPPASAKYVQIFTSLTTSYTVKELFLSPPLVTLIVSHTFY